MRCAGELYVSGGTEEYATPEWSYVVRAQCNAGIKGDCGFDLEINEETLQESGSWGITSKEMARFQRRHLKHSRGEK